MSNTFTLSLIGIIGRSCTPSTLDTAFASQTTDMAIGPHKYKHTSRLTPAIVAYQPHRQAPLQSAGDIQ